MAGRYFLYIGPPRDLPCVGTFIDHYEKRFDKRIVPRVLEDSFSNLEASNNPEEDLENLEKNLLRIINVKYLLMALKELYSQNNIPKGVYIEMDKIYESLDELLKKIKQEYVIDDDLFNKFATTVKNTLDNVVKEDGVYIWKVSLIDEEIVKVTIKDGSTIDIKRISLENLKKPFNWIDLPCHSIIVFKKGNEIRYLLPKTTENRGILYLMSTDNPHESISKRYPIYSLNEFAGHYGEIALIKVEGNKTEEVLSIKPQQSFTI